MNSQANKADSSHSPESLAVRYGIDIGAARLLDRYEFDADWFDQLRARLKQHIDAASAADSARPVEAASAANLAGRQQVAERNWISGYIEPPKPADLEPLAPLGSAERAELAQTGREAIAAGHVGVVLLAGGMATRFGGGVKALAEVLDGLTFADVKLTDLHRVASDLDCTVQLTLMSSFQSDAALREWALERHRVSDETDCGASQDSAERRVPVSVAAQGISLRLRADGDLFRDRDGAVSLHAPGHGDAPWAMQHSGLLERFADAGGRHLFVTNVDNAAATLDPAIIGAHLAAQRPLTCEVIESHAVGGSPWRVDGNLQIVESFRLPPSVDVTAATASNTNSLVADVEVFSGNWPFTWFEVHKQVAGEPAVQFERLIGELSAFVDTTMLVVGRDGLDGRFQPVKDPAELAARRPEIARILAERGVVG